MGRLAGFKYRDVSRKLQRFGFHLERQASGSHEFWNEPFTKRTVTISNHPGDIPEGTLRSILKQAGIEPDDFLEK